MTRDFLTVNSLTKNYGDFCAVDSLSFSVKEGEIFGLLGPNGAGKSTTLSVITSLLDFDKGDIIIHDKNILQYKMEVKKMLGLVPQDIAIYTHLNALENVKFFASLYGLRGKVLDHAAKEALEFVGLSKHLKIKPKKMSGGMKRRLNIACGIAHSPKLIVMDEPTVGVDTQSREHILNSIRVLQSRGATVIYTSHYMQEVEEICDRIAIMDRGKLIAIGTKDELVAEVTDIKTFYITTKLGKDDAMNQLKSKLMVFPGVKRVVIEENKIRLDMSVEHNSITHIVQEIIANQLPILDMNSEVPNLDTTFLALTGHELR